MPVRLTCSSPQCGQCVEVSEGTTASLACPRCGAALGAATATTTLTLFPGTDEGVHSDQQVPPSTLASQGRTLTLPPDGKGETGASGPTVQNREGPRQVGRFVVREFLGEGAFGEVYRARDPQLDRDVALKLAKPEMLSTANRVARFLREARAAAGLRHPHIVPVFDAGRDGSRYYIASAFIPGHTLEKELKSGRPDFQRAALLVRQLAEAMSYAHGQRIVHRDVKPSNIMLDEKGEPLLMDFGLAARADDEEKLTQEGQGMGTPAYMAPEQAVGKATAASDQYSLGCVLYELLTGRTPFEGPPELQVFLHRTEEPVRPRRLNRAMPRDLETICLKCLEKETSRRYSTTGELAEDLGRFLRSEPIQARRVGAWERTWRWGRRNPALATTGILAVLGLFATAIVFGVSAERQRVLNLQLQSETDAKEAVNRNLEQVNQELLSANEAKGTALTNLQRETNAKDEANSRLGESLRKETESRKQAVAALYSSLLSRAERELRAAHIELAETLLDSCPWDQRGWEWQHLKYLCHSDTRTFYRQRGPVAVSRDGKQIAVAGENETVVTLDAETGNDRFVLKGFEQKQPWQLKLLRFSPDGRLLLTVRSESLPHVGIRGTTDIYEDRPSELILWDLAAGKPAVTLQGGGASAVLSASFHPDGARLATASADRRVRIWDTNSGKVIQTLSAHTGVVSAVAYSPDGKMLASGGRDLCVILWDLATGKPTATLRGHVSLSGPHDSLEATAIPGTRIAAHGGQVSAVAFAPGGQRVSSAGPDGTVRIWDVANGSETAVLRGHEGQVVDVAFDPDGARVASAGRDGTVKVWSVADFRLEFTLLGHGGPVVGGLGEGASQVSFRSPDLLVSSGNDGEVKTWELRADRETLRFKVKVPFTTGSAIDPQGEWVAAAAMDRTVKVWGLANGREILTFRDHGQPIFTLTAGPGGLVASADALGRVLVWEARTGKVRHTFRGQPSSKQALVIHAGSNVLAGALGANIYLWDLATGKEIQRFPGLQGGTFHLAFHPDGKRLAGSNNLDGVAVWDTRDGRVVRRLPSEFPLWNVTFSPDGRMLAAVVNAHTVRLWDAESGVLLRTLHPPRRGQTRQSHDLTCLDFSPDGTRLVAGSDAGVAHLWNPHTGDYVFALREDSGYMPWVSFVRNGQALVGVTGRATARVWPAHLPPDVAYRAESLVLLDRVFMERVFRDDVLEHLRTNSSLAGPLRQVSLRLASQRQDDPQRWVSIAELFLCLSSRSPEEHQQALRTAEALVREAPSQAFALSLLGKAQYRIGQLDRACESLSEAAKGFAARAELPVAFLGRAGPRLVTPRDQAVNELFLSLAYRRLGKEEWIQHRRKADQFLQKAKVDIRKDMVVQNLLQEADDVPSD